jgi:ABC-type glycerol-3-phosphate transport system substrate-binding protein
MINSPEGVAALEYAVSLKDVGPANSVSIGFADLDKLFLAGQVGFIEQFSTTATKAQFDTTNSKVIGKFGVMALPAGPGGSKRQYSPGGVSLAVTKSTKNQELAYLCARYLACEETAVTQAVAGTGVEPTMATAYNNPDFQAKWGDGKTSWKVALQEGTGQIFKQIPIPEFAALQEALDLKLSEAYSGQTKPKDALDSVANSWKQILDKAGYYAAGKAKYEVQK